MATIPSDGTDVNINAIIAASTTHDGDIITLPSPGTFTWTVQVIVTKAITLQGGANPNGATGVVDLAHTVVRDGIINLGQPFIRIDAQAGEPTIPVEWHPGDRYVRISGIAFEPAIPEQTARKTHVIEIQTTIPVRVDHCSFQHMNRGSNYIALQNYNYGVIDHCVQKSWYPFGTLFAYPCLNRPDAGDYEFSQPANFGSYKFFFVEDSWVWHGSDISSGGKVCWRYSQLRDDECVHNGGTCNSAAALVSHGIGNNKYETRGGRAYEVYNCGFYYDHTDKQNPDGLTSGSYFIYDCDFSNITPTGVKHQVGGPSLNDQRFLNNEGGTLCCASGFSDWDINCRTIDANGNCTSWGEGPGAVFYQGTTTTNTANNTIIFSPNPAWPTDKWVGFSLYRVSDSMNVLITSNTNDTLTISQNHHTSYLAWGPNQLMQIGKVVTSFDTPGYGAGDMIDRANPAWDHSALEICRIWNCTNVDDGTPIGFGPNVNITGIQYATTPPPPGTYTPYTYPHPLVTGIAPGPTRVIVLAGTGLAFGSVVIGQATTGTLTVSNTGTALLTVTSVTYPNSVFTGATSGFTVAPGASHPITVTFRPLVAQVYSGNITVASDATAGTGTISISGTGLTPTPPIHGHRKQASEAFGF